MDYWDTDSLEKVIDSIKTPDIVGLRIRTRTDDGGRLPDPTGDQTTDLELRDDGQPRRRRRLAHREI